MILPSLILFNSFVQPVKGRTVLNFNSNWEKVIVPPSSTWPVLDGVDQDRAATTAKLQAAYQSEVKDSLGFKPSEAHFVPATLPDTAHVEPLNVFKPWQGICWYRKNFHVPQNWKGNHLILSLSGAMSVSNVLINGHLIGGREGGYLPVVCDLTPYIQFGTSNRIAVRLDNRDNPLVPPGKPTPDLDFLYYGGLYRDATLIVVPPIHLTNPFLSDTPKSGGVVFSTLQVSREQATVRVTSEVLNSDAKPAWVQVSQTIGDLRKLTPFVKIQPSSRHTFSVDITIKHPNLWSPSQPNLYLLRTTVKGGNSIDSEAMHVGIRRLVFSRSQGLLVNGVPTRLIGTNRHQEYPYIGNALSDNASLRDMIEIKKAGFNCVRLSHYPQDPAIMSACDRLGLFAIVCAPGWQYINSSPIFEKRVESDIKEMVRWHRNHPSVLAWESSLNETYPQKTVAEKWYAAAHSEFTETDMTTVSDFAHGFSWDWPYNQWDDATKGRPQNVPYKAGYIREYGDWEFGGATSTSRQPMTTGEKGQLQEAWNFVWCHNRDRSQWPWTMGDGTWVMYDYHRGYDPSTEASGMADVFRVPRYIYRFFQSQYSTRPYLFIANQWTQRTSPTKVVVFSNGDRVKLFLNGRLVGDQTPDSGPDTPYGDYDHGGNPWDGGNARHLVHPPFTFSNVPFEPGNLVAVSYRNGKVVSREEVKTPGRPTALKARINLQGIPLIADGADAVFVYVQVVDSKGSPCYENGIPVRLQLSGPATIVGPSITNTENGIATFLLQAGKQSGAIRLIASSDELRSAKIEIRD